MQWYTLPVLTLLLFVGSFGFLGSWNQGEGAPVAERGDRAHRAALFGDAQEQVAGAARAMDDPRLVGFWSFGEGAGVTTLDLSGSGKTGILQGSPRWVEDQGVTRLLFDGIDDYVSVEGSEALDTTSSFSISAWVKPERNSDSAILSKNGLDEENEGGYVMSVGEHRFEYGIAGVAAAAVGSQDIAPNKWLHFVVAYDANITPNTKLYVDGVHVLSSDITPPEDNGAVLVIGRDNEGNYFRGEIGVIRLYDTALDSNEIAEIYQKDALSYENRGGASGHQEGRRSLWTRILEWFKAK